jgi:hypothetical protein
MKSIGRPEAVLTAVFLGSIAVVSQSIRFEPVQKDLFAAGGAFVNAWADYDGDGDLDQFVGFDGAANRLYRNDKGTFSDVAATAGLAEARPTRAAAWGDFDTDGDPDLLVGFTPAPGASVLKLYRNTKGVFSDIADSVGLNVPTGAVRQPAWVDVDGDGDLDLFVAFRDKANALYRNDGGAFRDVAGAAGLADARRTVGAVWFDYDEDGDLDLITGNMDGDANGLFRQTKGAFEDVAAAAGVAWGGRTPGDKANGTVRPCVADIDNDGHLDLFFANYGKNGLFLNRGKGAFEDVSEAWGIAIDARYDSCAFGDMDNDGDLDLYVNGTITGGQQYRDYLFRNTGSKYEDVTPAEIGSPNGDHGVQWADYDLDGALDLSLTGGQKDGMHWLLRNPLAEPARTTGINVRVLDADGRATLAGAEISVVSGSGRRQKRLVDAGSGYNTQNDVPIHLAVTGGTSVTLELRVPSPRSVIVSTSAPIDLRTWGGRVYEFRLSPRSAVRKEGSGRES